MYLNVPRLFSLADAYYVWFGDVIEANMVSHITETSEDY